MKKIAAISLLVLLSVLLFVSSGYIRRSQAQSAVADLSITKTDSPDPVNAGSNLTYTITVTNNGPSAATNASWSDPLPAGTTFVSLPDVSGWSCTTPDAGDSGTVSCSNPSFAVGSSVFTLTVAVAPTVPAASTLSNTATVTSSTPDGTPGNNSSTATTTVRSPSIVTGSKSRSGGGTPGSALSYLIILANSSNSDQQDNPGNEFTDVLPADLTLVAASASGGTATVNTGTNTVTWNGVVPGTDSITISIDATIKAGTEDHTITNQGTISYDADGNGTNEASALTNTDSFVVGAAALNADLGVTKTAPDTAPSDSDLTYIITVINGGPDTATSATLTDTLQGNLTFVSLSQPAGWSCNSLTPGSGGTLTCSRDLPAGSGAQVFTLVAHIPSGTPDGTFYNNVATVSTTATDPTSENDVATAGTTVACTTDGIVTTSADDGPGSLRRAIRDACVGGTITFANTVVSPISLSGGQITIDKSLTIQGPGANLLTVQNTKAASTTSRVFLVNSGVTATISGLTISGGNPLGDGGGINNNGTLTVANSTISNNSGCLGDGIRNNVGSTLSVTNSTISNNSNQPCVSTSGGGIFNSGTSTVTNSTISNNSGSNGLGGGIRNDSNGTVTVTDSTISNNSASNVGGGISSDGTVNLRNSIIAGNNAPTGPDLNGTFNSQDYNLIGNTSGATISGTTTHNINNQSANLGALANNGGPTRTMLPLPGSPAINAGDSGASLPPDTFDLDGDSDLTEPLPVDQRGFARVVGGNFDIGAVETNYTITATAGTPQSAVINSAFATALKATVTESGNPQNGVSVTFTAPGSGASGTFPGPSATAVASTNSSGVATAPTFTANGTVGGPYNVVASIGTSLPTANFALTNNKLNQTITFGSLAARTFGDADFSVSATATSGLAVSLSASGNCTVTSPSPGTVHLTGPGSCTITASQSGNATYNAAPDVPQSFSIAKAASATAVSSSLNPSNVGQSVTFTATVTSTAGVPTGTVQFKDGGTNLGAAAALNGSGVAQFTTSALTAGSHTITADYSGDGNFLPSTGTLSPNQVVNNRPLISLSQPIYSVNENANFVTITVNRSGDTAPAVTVDYATQDDSGPSSGPCVNGGGLASSRCDFISAFGTLRFAATETQKTFVVLITQDTLSEGQEMFTLALSNPTGGGAAFATPFNGTVLINDSVLAAPPNAIDDATIFVRQHYHDFLNREPDAAGLAFWTNEINSCGANAQCIEVKRINVSAAFFLSIEFQQSGQLVRNSYVAALDRPATNNMPAFVEFERDTQAVQRGVIVGQPGAQAQLDANKTAFLNDFVTRAEYVGLYPTVDTPGQYVDKLYLHAAITPTPTERNNAVAEFGAAVTAADPGARGRVLQRVTQNTTFQQREFNPSFVQMEYLGYLRRNPNDPPDGNFTGFNFWLNKMNQFNGNFVNAEMVKAFISSGEYRRRFGP